MPASTHFSHVRLQSRGLPNRHGARCTITFEARCRTANAGGAHEGTPASSRKVSIFDSGTHCNIR